MRSSQELAKILLLAYKYPPYNLVGANRWKNFSYNLAELGHEVHVVTTSWNMDGVVPSHPNLNVHRISSGRLSSWKYKPLKKFPHLARQALFKFLLNPLLTQPGEDEASDWTKSAREYAEKLILGKNIKVLIATGAPFSVNYTAALIKKKLTDVILVQDFRDPWSRNLYDKHAKLHIAKEALSVSSSDAVISVTDKLLDEYVESYQGIKRKTIPNGYDAELIGSIEAATPMFEGLCTVLTHAGNVSNGREKPLKELLDAITGSEELRRKFRVVLIGTMDQAARRVISEHYSKHGNSNLKILPRMSQQKALSILKGSNYALQLNGPNNPAQVSTKIYEYAGLGLPTLSLNYGGEIEKLMESNRLGVCANLLRSDLQQILKNMPSKLESPLEASQMSFQNQAKLLSSLISELVKGPVRKA